MPRSLAPTKRKVKIESNWEKIRKKRKSHGGNNCPDHSRQAGTWQEENLPNREMHVRIFKNIVYQTEKSMCVFLKSLLPNRKMHMRIFKDIFYKTEKCRCVFFTRSFKDSSISSQLCLYWLWRLSASSLKPQKMGDIE